MDVAAALSVSVTSGGVSDAADNLDRFVGSVGKAGAASTNSSGSIAKLLSTIQSMNTKLAGIVTALDKISTSMAVMARASQNASSSQSEVARDAEKAAKAFAAADAHVLAYAEHLRQLAATPPPPAPPSTPSGGGASPTRAASSPYYGAAGIEETGQAARIAANDAQNLFYQLNDVFVSLASGQKPLTVFIQQGSQIGQVYMQTGMSLKGFALGLASMLGILKTTTAATEAAALASAKQGAASVAAANAQATANVRAAETNILIARTQVAMATTATEAAIAEARLTVATNALSVSQAEAAITTQALATAQAELATASAAARAATTTALTGIGIALAAVAIVLTAFIALVGALNRQASDTAGLKKFTTAMGYTKAEVEKLNAVSVTWGDTAKAVFQVGFARIASALGITTEELGKKWNSVLDWMATATRATIAGIYAGFTGMQNVIPRILDNIKTGKKESLFELIGGAYSDQYKEAQSFMDDVVKTAQGNARARQDAMASAMHDGDKSKTGGGDAFGFKDILKDAANAERELRAAGAEIGVYGEALARTRYESDLFNKAAEHGLKLTPQQTATIKSLSAALAELAENNRHAQFMEDFNQQTLTQITALGQARDAIGMSGAALAGYTYEMEQMNRATAEHIKLTEGDVAAIKAAAAGIEAATYRNIREKSANDNARDHAETMRQLDAERGAIGLTGDALVSYNRQQDLINAALAEGVQFKDLDIAKTKAQADAYAVLRGSVDRQAQAMADARDVAGGFFQTLFDGVRSGVSLFNSFFDAIISGLNRLIDKLLNKAIDGFLNSLLGSGGGILSGILGGGGGSVSSIMSSTNASLGAGTAGMATGFAKGGAFTNSVVKSPTLFRFANGGALGEMGEAGPEAIMPLKRGANGALGVQMHGGGGGRTVNAPINVQNDYHITGALAPTDIVALIRQGSAATQSEVKRNLQSWLSEIDRDGGTVG